MGCTFFFFFAFPKRLLHCCFAFSPHKVFKISHVQQLRNVAISNFPRTVVLFTYGNFSCTPRLPVLENKYTLDASPAQNKFQEIIQSGQAACRRNPKKTPSAFGREILWARKRLQGDVLQRPSPLITSFIGAEIDELLGSLEQQPRTRWKTELLQSPTRPQSCAPAIPVATQVDWPFVFGLV